MVTQLRLPSRCAPQVCCGSSLNSLSRLNCWGILNWMIMRRRWSMLRRMILLKSWDLLSCRGILSRMRLLVRLLCAWGMLYRWTLLDRNMLTCRGLLAHRRLLSRGRNNIWLPSWCACDAWRSDSGSGRCDTDAATADASRSAVIGHKRTDVVVGSVDTVDLRSWACWRLMWLCLVSVWQSRLRSGIW